MSLAAGSRSILRTYYRCSDRDWRSSSPANNCSMRVLERRTLVTRSRDRAAGRSMRFRIAAARNTPRVPVVVIPLAWLPPAVSIVHQKNYRRRLDLSKSNGCALAVVQTGGTRRSHAPRVRAARQERRHTQRGRKPHRGTRYSEAPARSWDRSLRLMRSSPTSVTLLLAALNSDALPARR